jgi:hypothetical protein
LVAIYKRRYAMSTRNNRLILCSLIIALVVVIYLFLREVSFSKIYTWNSDESSTQVRLIEKPYFLLPPWHTEHVIFQIRASSDDSWKEIVRQKYYDSTLDAEATSLELSVYFKSDKEIEIFFDTISAYSLDNGKTWEINKVVILYWSVDDK